MTIHPLEAGAYRLSPVSRAFPGWRAKDVHEAMNELVPSARTHAILERLGRTLGARGGTGPDDHSFLRSLRGESRAEGHAAGLAEGHAAGLAEGRANMIRRMLLSRGIEVSARFPSDVPGFAESSADKAVAAALARGSEADFRLRLR